MVINTSVEATRSPITHIRVMVELRKVTDKWQGLTFRLRSARIRRLVAITEAMVALEDRKRTLGSLEVVIVNSLKVMVVIIQTTGVKVDCSIQHRPLLMEMVTLNLTREEKVHLGAMVMDRLNQDSQLKVKEKKTRL